MKLRLWDKKYLRIMPLLLLCMLIICMPCRALAEPEQQEKESQDDIAMDALIREQIRGLDFSEWEAALSDSSGLFEHMTGSGSARELVESYAQGQASLSIQGILSGLFQEFMQAMRDNILMLLIAIGVCAAGGIFNSLKGSLSSQSIGDMVKLVTVLVVCGLVLARFADVVQTSIQAVDSMTNFMQAAFPILLTLLTAMGGIASTGVFQPAMALLSSGAGAMFRGVVVPLSLLTAALGMLSTLSERLQMKEMYNLSKSVCKWFVGITFTVFLGVMSIEGISASSFDGISMRTAKFAVDKILPVAGSMFSDTVDTVVGCSLVVKNAVGVSSLIVLCSILIGPLMHIAAFGVTTRLAGALCEPIAPGKVSEGLIRLSGAVSLLFAAVLAVSIMVLITISLSMSASNINLMMR